MPLILALLVLALPFTATATEPELENSVRTLTEVFAALEENLADPAFVEKMTKFVRASMKGWEYARANPEEAAQIVLDNDSTGAMTLEDQLYQVSEVNKLTEGSTGVLDEADYQQTVDTLLSAVSPDNPAITKAPEGAFSHVVTDGL